MAAAVVVEQMRRMEVAGQHDLPVDWRGSSAIEGDEGGAQSPSLGSAELLLSQRWQERERERERAVRGGRWKDKWQMGGRQWWKTGARLQRSLMNILAAYAVSADLPGCTRWEEGNGLTGPHPARKKLCHVGNVPVAGWE